MIFLFKVIYRLLLLGIVIVLLALTFSVGSFFGVPIYQFPEPTSFTGEVIYNPYKAIDSSSWVKGNYHAHQREKPRCDYTVETFLAAYRAQEYDVIGLSDHNYINLDYSGRAGFIPSYEHGWNINRFHQGVLGADGVWWRDIPIVINTSQMQFILNRLNREDALIVLNHPGQTRRFTDSVYSHLQGYDLLELNPERGEGRRSLPCWDEALSAGIYVNMISNDDAHSISNRGSFFQRSFTMLNTPSLSEKDQLHNLKRGAAYGVFLSWDRNQIYNPHDSLPTITQIGLSGDTISLSLSAPAESIRFVGAHGAIQQSDSAASKAYYIMQEEDPYIRIEAIYADGVELYSNPFVRTLRGTPAAPAPLKIDWVMSVLTHLIWLLLVLLLIRLFWGSLRLLFRRKRKKERPYYSIPHTIIPPRTNNSRR